MRRHALHRRVVGKHGCQLQEREWVSSRKLEHAGNGARLDRVAAYGEQLQCVIVRERKQLEPLEDAIEVRRLARPHGNEEHELLSLEAARREHERVRRGNVEPLGVVDRD